MASLDDTTNPSGRLIAAKQVQGAAVSTPGLRSLAPIEDVMIDKASGRIAYAILAYGGFLGIGDRFIRCRGRSSATIPKWAATSWMWIRMCWRARRPTPMRRRRHGRTTFGGGASIPIGACIRSGIWRRNGIARSAGGSGAARRCGAGSVLCAESAEILRSQRRNFLPRRWAAGGRMRHPGAAANTARKTRQDFSLRPPISAVSAHESGVSAARAAGVGRCRTPCPRPCGVLD